MTIKKVQLTTASGETFDAEEGVPIHAPNRGKGVTAKLRALKVGQSLLFTEYSNTKCFSGLFAQIRSDGFRFTGRKEEKGVRVWRIE
jgi:hypothetical protein